MELDIESRIFKETTRLFFENFISKVCSWAFSFSLSRDSCECAQQLQFEKKGRNSDVESVRLGINRTGTRLPVNACFHKSRQLLFRVRIDVVVCVRHIFRRDVCNFHIFSGPRVKNYLPLPSCLFKQMRKEEEPQGSFQVGNKKNYLASFYHSLNDYSRNMLFSKMLLKPLFTFQYAKDIFELLFEFNLPEKNFSSPLSDLIYKLLRLIFLSSLIKKKTLQSITCRRFNDIIIR